jgi:hypothetical protein
MFSDKKRIEILFHINFFYDEIENMAVHYKSDGQREKKNNGESPGIGRFGVWKQMHEEIGIADKQDDNNQYGNYNVKHGRA